MARDDAEDARRSAGNRSEPSRFAARRDIGPLHTDRGQ